METKNIYNLIILDESGSMSSIERQAVSAINETIQGVRNAQKANPQQNYFISLVVFEGEGVKGVRTVRDRVPVENIEDIRQEEYRPGACTPLYDAMGVAISNLRKATRKEDPVLVTIITDGMENSSIMISISLCKVGVKAILIFNLLTIVLLVSTLHNDIND